jgi:hypothetical protein
MGNYSEGTPSNYLQTTSNFIISSAYSRLVSLSGPSAISLRLVLEREAWLAAAGGQDSFVSRRDPYKT